MIYLIQRFLLAYFNLILINKYINSFAIDVSELNVDDFYLLM